MLPVNAPAPNADALFEQAQAAEDGGDVAEAERLYRVLMNCDPTDAAPPFNLGNMLRANGRKCEAEAALRAATRADPTFAEAWYNLSDLLDEQGRSEAAIDCLRRALHAAPDYADAMFNLALLLQRGSRHKEAAELWRQYLANDAQSEWAARARRSLKLRNANSSVTVLRSCGNAPRCQLAASESEEKREPASDIDTVPANSLKAAWTSNARFGNPYRISHSVTWYNPSWPDLKLAVARCGA